MAQATLTWTVAGGGGNQTVQYKRRSESVWIDYQTVPAGTNSITITNLLDNVVYDFRIQNNCDGGVPTPSGLVSKSNITCPTVSPSAASTEVSFSFTPLGGDITRYVVDLLDSSGTNVLNSQTFNTPFGSTVSGTFSNLSSSTNYNIRVTVYAGAGFEYSKVCPNVAQTTGAPSACPAPTNVVVEMTPST